jgi:hypothetical protein
VTAYPHDSAAAPPAEPASDAGRAELLAEALDDVCRWACHYIREPGDAAWHTFVTALARAHGDEPAYDLLRAVEIHTRVARLR